MKNLIWRRKDDLLLCTAFHLTSLRTCHLLPQSVKCADRAVNGASQEVGSVCVKYPRIGLATTFQRSNLTLIIIRTSYGDDGNNAYYRIKPTSRH